MATSSLPVPLSPWISTVLETGAICSILTSTSWMAALSPMMPVRSWSPRRSISRRAVATASSGATGFIIGLGDAEAADPLGALGVGGLEQGEGGDLGVAGQGGELEGVGLVDRAGEDDQLGALAADGAARASSSGENMAVEKPAASNAALSGTAVDEVVHGDEDAGGHGGKISGRGSIGSG